MNLKSEVWHRVLDFGIHNLIILFHFLLSFVMKIRVSFLLEFDLGLDSGTCYVILDKLLDYLKLLFFLAYKMVTIILSTSKKLMIGDKLLICIVLTILPSILYTFN